MRIDAMDELTIGFVGLGNMGWPMAANLHAAGFSLVVRDADAARQARFAAEHPDYEPTYLFKSGTSEPELDLVK